MKPSGYVQLVQKVQNEARQKYVPFALQEGPDITLITLGEMGLDSETLHTFMLKYKENWEWVAKFTIDDAKDDKKLNYTKGKVDQELEKYCGEYFIPWEERYN